MPLRQTDLFSTTPDWPDGFDYRQELISAGDEQALIETFAALPFKPFEFQNYLGKREVVNFGWRYDYGGGGLQPAPAMPDVLVALRRAACAFAGAEPQAFVQALVTRYDPGVTIGWHRDRPVYETVIGVSLAAPAVLRFRRRSGQGWERRTLTVAPRSAYVLRGPARESWEHSLRPAQALRYSVTFRSLRSPR